MVQKVILDIDTGTDDAVALMFAALHPALELIAATTVNGNVPVANCTENTLRTLDYIGVNVPVFEGMAAPIVRPDFPVPRSKRGVSDVHGEYLDIPAAISKKQDVNAIDFLIGTYLQGENDVILVATAPLTNIAMALKREPRIVAHIPELVIMGGGHEVGNQTPAAEFNIWADPEAARIVINSGIPKITLVPLDATHRALVSLDDCQRLRDLGTPAGKAAAIFTERRIAAYDKSQPMSRLNAAPIHDALAVAYVVESSVISTMHVNVDVETSGELTVGRTVIDTHRRSGKVPNVNVALDADEPKFVQLLLETLARVH